MFSEPILLANELLIPDGDSIFLSHYFGAVGHFCPVSEPLKLDIKGRLARNFIVCFSHFFRYHSIIDKAKTQEFYFLKIVN